MKRALHQVQAVIQSGGKNVPSDDPLLHRLALAIRGVQPAVDHSTRTSGAVASGPADLAILIRQAVLGVDMTSEDACEVIVPQEQGWPDETQWRRHSCDAVAIRAGSFRVTPRAWHPHWLDSGAENVVTAAIQAEARLQRRTVPSDPAVEVLLDLHSYISPGQRAAVQAAFLTPHGSTSIVSLPTGGGKSLAFQLPALASRRDGGVVIVIMPTTALARDQEARFRELLKKHGDQGATFSVPFAYHSGLDEDSRSAIRKAIRHGETPFVLTSPEAAVGALRSAIIEAAKHGHLRLLAIDEAHLIAQWGEHFRPQFQMLAGFRDILLEVCPPTARFRTLLLTATLTPEAHETLRFLFGYENTQLVCELALRPEISFLLHNAPDEAARIAHVLEGVDHLPRPLILYSTLREHAENWYERLCARGYQRLRLVRGGDLADEEGERVLEGWRRRSIDIVVATSAFGVGMDQSEVRTVVHACLPETIDRYYQEVGRAGRDGNAAVALLASAPEDVDVAHDLAEKRRISVERGFERWQYMWWNRRHESDTTYVLRLDVSPPDVTASSQRNESWNLRTLVLMARAGLIAFAAHSPPQLQQHPDEPPEEFERRLNGAMLGFSKEIAVRVRDDRHLEEAHWDATVALLRLQLRAQDDRAKRLVDELGDLLRPLNDLFTEVYTLPDPPARPPRLAGNCPITRERRTVSYVAARPEVIPLSRIDIVEGSELARHLGACTDDARRSWISYAPPIGTGLELRDWTRRVVTLLRQVVAQGVLELCLPEKLCTPEDWSRLLAEAPTHFLVRGLLEEEQSSSPLPRLTLLGSEQINLAAVDLTVRLARPRHIIILPRNAPNPSHRSGLLFDRIHHLELETLMTRLRQ